MKHLNPNKIKYKGKITKPMRISTSNVILLNAYIKLIESTSLYLQPQLKSDLFESIKLASGNDYKFGKYKSQIQQRFQIMKMGGSFGLKREFAIIKTDNNYRIRLVKYNEFHHKLIFQDGSYFDKKRNTTIFYMTENALNTYSNSQLTEEFMNNFKLNLKINDIREEPNEGKLSSSTNDPLSPMTPEMASCIGEFFNPINSMGSIIDKYPYNEIPKQINGLTSDSLLLFSSSNIDSQKPTDFQYSINTLKVSNNSLISSSCLFQTRGNLMEDIYNQN